MKLGIISDTHGGLKGWERALAGPLSQVDLILHAGDLLYRNCDAEVDQLLLDYPIQSPYVYIHIDNLAILMLHGHELEVEDMWVLGDRYKINLLISGHTHLYKLLQKGPLTLINPGSPSLPKGEEIPTVALLDTEQLTVAIVRIDTNAWVKEMRIIL